jgi:RNA polymerase sigma factor (sigma-70 family)
MTPQEEKQIKGYARRLARYAPTWFDWEDLYQVGALCFHETGVVWYTWRAMANELQQHGKWMRTKKERVEELPIYDLGIDPASIVETNQFISRLPKRERILVKAFHEGKRQKEVAEILGCSEGRVSQLRTGLQKLAA